MNLIGKIFDIKKYAVNDGPGIRTTVFFMGCPLDCRWCHNPECRVSGHDNRIGRSVTVDKIAEEFMKDRLYYEESGGGITFSGGEPLMQADFLEALLDICRFEEIPTAIDTSGYVSHDSFVRIINKSDLILFDLKIMNDVQHIKYTGVSNKPILENLKYLSTTGKRVMIRVPLIPEATDTEENLRGIAENISRLEVSFPVCLLPYNKLGEDKVERFNLDRDIFKRDTQSADILKSIRDLMESYGLEVQIGG